MWIYITLKTEQLTNFPLNYPENSQLFIIYCLTLGSKKICLIARDCHKEGGLKSLHLSNIIALHSQIWLGGKISYFNQGSKCKQNFGDQSQNNVGLKKTYFSSHPLIQARASNGGGRGGWSPPKAPSPVQNDLMRPENV